MRGEERRQRAMLVLIDPEPRMPNEHPSRRIRQLADAAFAKPELYEALEKRDVK